MTLFRYARAISAFTRVFRRAYGAGVQRQPDRASSFGRDHLFLRAFNDLMRRNFTFSPWCCSGLSTRTEMSHGQVRWRRVKAGDARSKGARISHDVYVRFLALLWGWKMRAFTIAAIIAVLAVPANAQNVPILGGDGGRGKLGKKSDEQIAAEQQQKKNEDNAYKDALKKIPNHPVKPADPWGTMR